MHRAAGLALHGVVDDAPGDAVDQQHAHEAALRVGVRALRHHRQQVGVQVLEGGERGGEGVDVMARYAFLTQSRHFLTTLPKLHKEYAEVGQALQKDIR